MTQITEYAKQLASILSQMDELKVAAADIVGSAKDAGINVRALKQVAKEMNMEAEKLRKRLDDEDQLSLFREEVGLHVNKGIPFAGPMTTTTAAVHALKAMRSSE